MIRLKGTYTALVTPFKNGKVNFTAFERQIEFQISSGISGIVPCGTTGESPTLSHKEHRSIITAAVKTAGRRVGVIAGTGSNSTEEAVELTRFAKKAGADAVLSVVPYYNKPTQEGLYLHFKRIASRCSIPIILYNIPGRCGVSLSPLTIQRLSRLDWIIGIKESTGNMDQASDILSRTKLTLLSGDDSLTLPLLAIGAQGVISVAANIFPTQINQILIAYFNGDEDFARRIHIKMYSLIKSLFIETNPVPVKSAMKILGTDSAEFRLPLCSMKKENLKILRKEVLAFKSAASNKRSIF